MDYPKPSGTEKLLKGSLLYPQESPLRVKSRNFILEIGIPDEVAHQEKRVPLTPSSVGLLTAHGVNVSIEAGAGTSARFSDQDFSEQGAKIVYSKQEIFEKDIVLKVEAPLVEEIELMKPGSKLISSLSMDDQTLPLINAIRKKKITALGYHLLEDSVGGLPIVRAMGEIAGNSVMQIAGELLSTTTGGKGKLLGGITGVPPSQVVIIGAGTVAEYAGRIALGLGASVKVYDDEIYKLRRIQNSIGHQIYTSTINNMLLARSLKTCDVLIGAHRSRKGRPGLIVSEEMVASMKPGSVIIDVSIDQGGCIETSKPTSHTKPTFAKHDVIHYCVPNIASRVARTATTALSNIFTPLLVEINEVGGFVPMIFQNTGFMKGIYSYKGNLTNRSLARQFELPFKELELLIAAGL